MRVAVTGGSGRLGRSVVRSLGDEGHEVISLDVMASPEAPATETLPADVSDLAETYEAIARYRPDAIVHLAAIAVPFSRPESRIYRTNTQLAFNVCQVAADLGVRTVVLASSPTVIGYGNPLGWSPHYLPLDEDHPAQPWNAYALSKLAVEDIMRTFSRQQGDRMRFAAIRPCYVISPEEWTGLPTQQGETVRERLDRPEQAAVSLFNYIDARDAADLVELLLRRADDIPNGQVFFAGAADALAREPLRELLPRFSPETRPYSGGLTGSAPAFTSAKAERLLGWKPRRSWRTELAD